MIGTILRRITVHTLDRVVERGRSSELAPVRIAAAGLDRVRGLVGLDRIDIRLEIPGWDGSAPDQPMWQTDRDKLRKWQLDRGILKPEKGAEAKPAEPALTIYFKRGCPYCRAALDLAREQNIPVKAIDYSDNHDLRTAIRTRTGRKTAPHVFIREQCVGGFDELRELHESGRLAKLLADPKAEVPTAGSRGATAEDDDEGDGRELAPKALQARLADGAKVLLLDVREPNEWAQTGVIAGAVTISLGQLADRAAELDPQGVWIAYCRSGRRSLQAVDALTQRGFRSVVSLRGGIEAWRGLGGATVPLAQVAPVAPAKKTVKLAVLHPERSPFEALLDEVGAADTERLEGDALIARVREVLDECRPLVQADGGDIELLDVEGDVVGVKLTGNCIGCPSSQATLKQGIERKLKQKIPQLKGIRSPQLAPAN